MFDQSTDQNSDPFLFEDPTQFATTPRQNLLLNQNQINYLVQLIITLVKSETIPLQKKIMQICKAMNIPNQIIQSQQVYIPNNREQEQMLNFDTNISLTTNQNDFDMERPPKLDPYQYKMRKTANKNKSQRYPFPHPQNYSRYRHSITPPQKVKANRQENPAFQIPEHILKQNADSEVLQQFKRQWQREYNKILKQVQMKRSHSQKNWKEEDKSMIIDFVNKGERFGISRKTLLTIAKVSNSSYKRWKGDQPMIGED